MLGFFMLKYDHWERISVYNSVNAFDPYITFMHLCSIVTHLSSVLKLYSTGCRLFAWSQMTAQRTKLVNKSQFTVLQKPVISYWADLDGKPCQAITNSAKKPCFWACDKTRISSCSATLPAILTQCWWLQLKWIRCLTVFVVTCIVWRGDDTAAQVCHRKLPLPFFGPFLTN